GMPTAAAVVIGNEILSGKFQDANSPWLAARCRSLGIDLVRIHVIPDEVEVIAATVAEASALVDHVFTTGGVGPTHDDLTMAGIAAAYGVALVRHPDLERVLRERMGERTNPAALRMADVPEGASLWWEDGMTFPQVVMRNVVVFPGVPRLLRLKYDAIAHRLSAGLPVLTERLVSTAAETDIAAGLAAAQARYPSVEIGSYPQYDEKPYTVTVTMDSRDGQALAACLAHLRGLLTPGA
ncbi:MAG: competence/damage-inducible protein A, partial [Myxococcota bacterium]|nr:competence/damage-inducible protein A [Myxococcota bacterium]